MAVTINPLEVSDSAVATYDRPFQVGLRGMLVIVAGLGLLFKLATAWDAPGLFIAGPIALVWWLVYKVLHISRAGTILSVAAGEFLALAGLAAMTMDGFGRVVVDGFTMLGCICTFAATTTFLMVAVSRQAPYDKRNGLCAAVPIVTLVLWGAGVLPAADAYRRERAAERKSQNAALLQAIVTDVNAECVRLGCAPQDEAELVRLLGKPVPKLATSSGTIPIRYRRVSPNRFDLSYIGEDDWDIHHYDSQKGWYVEHF